MNKVVNRRKINMNLFIRFFISWWVSENWIRVGEKCEVSIDLWWYLEESKMCWSKEDGFGESFYS